MSDAFHFRLPDCPPQRLVREAVIAWGLRHLDEDKLDAETSSWPLVRGAVLSYLRHLHTDYDERLRARCEHDPKLRDTLVAQVAVAAFRRYPWLGKDDPRPFPEAQKDSAALPFDLLSRDLADLHSCRDHLFSAIHDLKRQGKTREQIAALQCVLEETQQDIQRHYKLLSGPKVIKEEHKVRLILSAFPKAEADRYHFSLDKPVTSNRIEYVGFRCSRCGVSVARWKQSVPLGQGYRCVIFACHCITAAIHCPPAGSRLAPMTLGHWQEFCESTNNKYSNPTPI